MPRVVYVEDNIYICSGWLTRKGFEIAVAPDGEGGVVGPDRRPDLILMDLSLLGLDGREATRRITAAPEIRAIPVMALAAHAMTGHRERALSAGCDDSHSKSVDVARLLGKTRALLPGGGA